MVGRLKQGVDVAGTGRFSCRKGVTNQNDCGFRSQIKVCEADNDDGKTL